MSGFHSIFSPADNVVRSSFGDLGPPDRYTDSDPRKEGKLYDKEELLDRALSSTRQLGATVAAGGPTTEVKKTSVDRASIVKLVGSIVRAILAKKQKGLQVNKKKQQPKKKKGAVTPKKKATKKKTVAKRQQSKKKR